MHKSLTRGLGKEDNILLVDLQPGVEDGLFERWRGGELVQRRPLRTVRVGADDVGAAVAGGSGGGGGTAVRLAVQDDSGKESVFELSARSAADAASMKALLLVVRQVHAHGVRKDDGAMPPVARMAGWLSMKPSAAFGKALKVPPGRLEPPLS